MKQTTLLILIAIIALPIFAQAQFNKYPIPYRKGDKWGYCDEKKNIIVEPIYDEVEFYEDKFEKIRFASLKKDGKYGIVDEKGKVIVPVIYKTCYIFLGRNDYDGNIYAIVQKNGKEGIIKADGTNKIILPIIYDDIYGTEYTSKRIKDRNYFYAEDRKGIYLVHLEKGLIKTIETKETQNEVEETGKNVDEFVVDASGGYYEKRRPFREMLKAKEYQLKAKEIKLFSDQHEDLFKELLPDAICQLRHTEWMKPHKRNDKSYFKILKNGKVGIIEYEELKSSNVEFYIKPKYQKLVDYKLSDPKYKADDYFFFKKGKKIKIVGYKTGEIISFKYDSYSLDKDFFGIVTVQNGKKGYINFVENYEIKPLYDEIKYYPYSDYELFEVTKNGKKGYTNRYGVEYFED